ncbi:MAG: hypothetical protein Q8P05_03685 [Candidatus Diapherotrites archaeon]|nr:hypothetical protein [Candidatus Diapherotrites archaeon]MDZ4256913.1 hypothetical protein [archaeon]
MSRDEFRKIPSREEYSRRESQEEGRPREEEERPFRPRQPSFLEGLKNNLIIGVIFLIILLMLVPHALEFIFPQLGLIIKLVMIFGIYSFVREFLGDSSLTWLITGILVYILVFKYGEIFASLWFVSIVLATLSGTTLVIIAKDFLGFGPKHGG